MTQSMSKKPRSLMDGKPFIETKRLTLREVHTGDARFILRLVNEPSFIQHIGDKDVRNLADACQYIESGPMASYAKHGFGLFLVTRKSDGVAVGTCGLLRRDSFDDPDLGYAFLPEHWSQGYAFESTQLILERAARVLDLSRIVAVTAPDNTPSIALLAKLNFVFEKTIDFSGDSTDSNFYALSLRRDASVSQRAQP